MWLDAEGNVHTVANLHPETVFHPDSALLISRLDQRRLRRLSGSLEQLRDELDDVLEELEFSEEENRYVESPLPRTHLLALSESVSGEDVIAEVLQALDAFPVRWRLDALDAVQDFVDELLDD